MPIFLDLDKDARGNDQAVQRLDRPNGRLIDVDDPLVRPHLELLA